MEFNDKSNVTIVLTSCGRFDLLKKTLASLDQYNTYPIREVIFTEDSGDAKIHDILPAHWKPHSRVFLNNPRRGQLASIDLAYQNVQTEYIFHCEDDWEFYRHNFIEDSMKALESDPDIIQVWLRSYHHDLRKNCLGSDTADNCMHFLGDYKVTDNTGFYKLGCNTKEWMGFSFNPGLRRLSDYDTVKPFAKHVRSAKGESLTSIAYANLGKYAVILENSAVMHIGWEQHIVPQEDIKRLKKNKRLHRLSIVLGLIISFITGMVIASW